MRPFFLLLKLSFAPAFALGLADGVKIGEVTDHSAVLWMRLTAEKEATNQEDQWDPENPHWRVPGVKGEACFTYWAEDQPDAAKTTPKVPVSADSDFCHQVTLTDLKPVTRYRFKAVGRDGTGTVAFLEGSFSTAPVTDSDGDVFFTVSTCQDFPRRDDKKNGHKIYASMRPLKPAFFIQAGDTLYYDKPDPFARDIATARYKWNRIYALPNLREFHQDVPSYWMHDDHDVLKNDCWPGQKYGDLTWEQGLKVWREQVPQSAKPYRSFRWGRHLEIFLPEGREYRSPNNQEDGPGKTIFGKEQWAWLEKWMTRSDATFKLFVSATPVVGPDRNNKNDNHANNGYEHEGKRLRGFLHSIPGCIVINGDRHWQYHSVDPVTGLQEFGCGPASDQHAGGWNPNDKLPEQRFLRVKGGFLSVKIEPGKATLTHHDVDGRVVNETSITAPAP